MVLQIFITTRSLFQTSPRICTESYLCILSSLCKFWSCNVPYMAFYKLASAWSPHFLTGGQERCRSGGSGYDEESPQHRSVRIMSLLPHNDNILELMSQQNSYPHNADREKRRYHGLQTFLSLNESLCSQYEGHYCDWRGREGRGLPFHISCT